MSIFFNNEHFSQSLKCFSVLLCSQKKIHHVKLFLCGVILMSIYFWNEKRSKRKVERNLTLFSGSFLYCDEF